MTDLFTVDFSTLDNDHKYSAILEFAAAQPNESNRHDFKSVWTDDGVKDVAAFANTFGGLLLIGVGKAQTDTQANMLGVTSASELTTRIASMISTNISPTPSYDIMECNMPGEASRRFCVVRVRTGPAVYLVTKKGLPPAWVRNADQTVPADAARLRSLMERQGLSIETAAQALVDRSQEIFNNMIIGSGYEDSETWFGGRWDRSQTYFKIGLFPTERKLARLDVREETRFLNLVHKHYRRIEENVGRVASDAANRDADFYEYRWYHKNLDYEGRWRITSELDVAHASQIRVGSEWSLVDIVMYAILMLRLGGTWWREFSYFGDGILSAELNVEELRVHRGAQRQFLTLFGPISGDWGMRGEILKENLQRRGAIAYTRVSAATMLDDVPRLVTSIMNHLLRAVGHAVLWTEFEDDVRIIDQGSL